MTQEIFWWSTQWSASSVLWIYWLIDRLYWRPWNTIIRFLSIKGLKSWLILIYFWLVDISIGCSINRVLNIYKNIHTCRQTATFSLYKINEMNTQMRHTVHKQNQKVYQYLFYVKIIRILRSEFFLSVDSEMSSNTLHLAVLLRKKIIGITATSAIPEDLTSTGSCAVPPARNGGYTRSWKFW